MKMILSNNPKYDHIVKWCLEDVLKLDRYDIKITFCVLFNGSGEFSFPNKISIEQHLDESKIIMVLFHEIRHYYQHIRNMFDFDETKYYTKTKDSQYDGGYDENGKQFYNLFLYETYLNLPWELDAKEFEMETWRTWLKSGKTDSQKHIWHGNYDNYYELS